MTDIKVTVSSDGLKAYLWVSGSRESNFPAIAELAAALKESGVVFGVNTGRITAMQQQKICNAQVEVAQGVPPKPGQAGRIEVLVDTSGKGKPKELDGGRVDHHDLRYFINVEKNTPLARRIPPTPGEDGRTVLGNSIAAPKSTDAVLVAGTGTCISEKDPDLLVAKIDGGISINTEGRLEVRDQKKIQSDIDYGTGNIKFSGDLLINGTVRAGFSVEATGSITIGGNVEDSTVRSGAAVEITGSAVGGGKGIIECAGSVRVRHVGNFTIRAGQDITVTDDAMHSSIAAEGIVNCKVIMGGTIAAGKGIIAESIGSTAETRTVVDVGLRYTRMHERQELLRQLLKETTNLVTLRQEMYSVVKDTMDDNGELTAEFRNSLAKLNKKKIESIEKCRLLQEQIQIREKMEECTDVPFFEARNIAPNTLLKYGEGERLIMENMTNVKLFFPADSARKTEQG